MPAKASLPPHPSTKAAKAAYKNPALSAEARARDLLSRMSLEEKAAQMVGIWRGKEDKLVNAEGDFELEKARAAFPEGFGIGQIGRPSDAGGTPSDPSTGKDARGMAVLTNAIQKFFLQSTRLGIPTIFHEECLHGHAARDATSFPQPIGLAATFDPELVEALYAMTAREARARGAHQALTPVVDVARDPRWGRVEETFGEDPYLVARLGCAAVRGFQGDGTFRDRHHLIATLKHFAAHGQPEGGQNCGPANVSERELREVFLSPFKAAIEAGAGSVMASYNEVNGVPSHANRWLLREVLREEWGFEGFVVSDYNAVWELSDRPETHGHFVAANRKEAAALAIRAGVNIELPDPDCYRFIAELVTEGSLDETLLDDLVEPMLVWKFRLGLFDDPYVDPDEAERIAGCEAHRGLALRAARETITLLKNEGDLLPLKLESLRTIAVIGPNAARPLLGGYSGLPKHQISVLEGIQARVRDGIEVLYSEGCGITVGGSWHGDEVILPDPEADRRQIAEAVEVARRADVIVLAIGGNEQTSREAWARNHLGDRASLDLVGAQEELVQAMVATGKPVVALLFNGRPLAIGGLSQCVPALLECWYLGQEGGRAVAEVLFGDVNPSGKLPISIPRSAGHLPSYYNHKPSARRGYLFADTSPLYPFGYGLSFTRFAVENLRLLDPVIRPDGSTSALVEVTNAGGREGTEVVQMYLRDLVSSVTRPVKELKGFARVTLQPGETRTVALEISPASLAFYDLAMEYVVEPGEFAVMVGTSSRDEDLQKVILRVER